MNERTDLGWHLWSVDQPVSGITNPSFSGGIFSGTSTATGDPNFFLLDSGIPGAAQLGKIGTNYPIDANKYTVLAFRMSVGTNSAAQLFWSTNTMFDDYKGAGNISVYAGWNIYVQSIPALPIHITVTGPWAAWGGMVRSLRLDPTVQPNDPLQVDWVRLVGDDATLKRNITWTGPGSVDIYLDDDNNAANGNLGAIARGVSGGTYSFFAGALPAGNYWVAITPAGGSTFSYSAGYYAVDGIPTFKFTSPNEEGSSDDFATTQLGNPWDMNATTDIDTSFNLSTLLITTIQAETEAGASLGTVGVLRGTSIPALPGSVGDPELYPLWAAVRGATHHINPNWYRILTLNMGLPGARDIVSGSIARVIWRVAGESVENVSDDIIVNSKSGPPYVLDKIIADMKTLPLETDAGGSPSTTGWNPGISSSPGIDSFRVDPHEFSSPTDFFIQRVKLAAFEQTTTSYQVAWAYTPSGSAATLSLYYDATGVGYTGTLIASGLNPANVDATHGSYTWDTSALAVGQYYIYAQLVKGGSVIDQTYARWPIVKVVIPAPTVTGISPTAGPTAGGTSVTITGTAFQTGATVSLGGVAATGVVVSSATTITATTGAHAAGAVNVVVTNPDAQSGTLASGFTYVSGSATLTLSHSVLNFGGTTDGAYVTSAQQVTVNIAGGTATWAVSAGAPFIQVSPASGSGTGTFSVSMAAGTVSSQSGTITVTGTGVINPPQTVQVNFRAYPSGGTGSPFGYIETPLNNSVGVVGAVPVTGWALDDIEVVKVDIWRNPMPLEPVRPNGLVYIGDAIFSEGARPDVEATYPTHPWAYRAGWGYQMLTNFLPNGGNGVFRISAYAYDREGHAVLLGTNTITCDNAHATKPFGTIDFPSQGGVISGSSYRNHGWVLTPQPCGMPLDGSTMVVYIDGVGLGGHPLYNLNRPDVEGLFPGLVNTSGAGGYYDFSTLGYSNGVHTIAWGVIDSCGRAEGIGSRYFTVLNGASPAPAGVGGG